MEPRIQYAKTSDGVSIAYAVIGNGTPLVLTSATPGRVHMYGLGLTALENRLVEAGSQTIIYDWRGMGSSDRRSTDFSIEARIRDLEAVIAAVRLERFVIGFGATGAHVAAALAVRQPERVSHLVAVNPASAVRDLWQTWPVFRAMQAMEDIADEEWETLSLIIANSINEFTDASAARNTAEAYRSGIKASAMITFLKVAMEHDPAELFASVEVPALVVFDRSTGRPRAKESAQRLAQGIPGAQFVETDDAARAIAEFVGMAVSAPRPQTKPELPSGTAVILFADIADSTALTERLGDAAFRARARDLDAALRAVIRDHAGTAIEGKLLGDGVLAVFTSARRAIESALACARAGADAGLPLHLGLHAGDVIREENNVYGGAVNIASRISGLSVPGEVLVSDIVRGLARTSAGVTFEDRGERELKGVGEAVRVWAVRQGE
jgi:class 3 adenylate cyclase